MQKKRLQKKKDLNHFRGQLNRAWKGKEAQEGKEGTFSPTPRGGI